MKDNLELNIQILEWANSSNDNIIRYIKLEKLFYNLLEEYINKQHKSVIRPFGGKNFKLDLFAPDGFDEFKGGTAIDFKVFRNYKKVSTNRLNDLITKTINNIVIDNKYETKINNIIFIVLTDTDIDNYDFLKKFGNFNFKITIWTVFNLCEKLNLQVNELLSYIGNIDEKLLNMTIDNSLNETEEEYKKEQDYLLDSLKHEYNNNNLSLFIGAGVSMDANIPSWNKLISELFINVLKSTPSLSSIELSIKEKEALKNLFVEENGNSPIQQIRYIKSALREDFENILRDIIYSKAKQSSNLLRQITELCIPSRTKQGIQSIINYNFDDLIEKNLEKNNVRHEVVYLNRNNYQNDSLPIYHVHGFLPESNNNYDNLDKSLLVFSEEGYHQLLLNPYHWSNLIQLNILSKNSCLFIGLSMTDPNLRRLLEVASLSKEKDTNKHFVILKRHIPKEEDISLSIIDKYTKVNEKIKQDIFNDLNISIIWVNNYNDIPDLLSKIKS